MEVGQVIKTRSIRSYFSGKEARGYADFRVDSERKRDKQKAFVLVLLGTEPLYGGEETQLDCNRVLRLMGWMPGWIHELPKTEKGRQETFKKVVEHLEFCVKALEDTATPRVKKDLDIRTMISDFKQRIKQLRKKAKNERGGT